MFEGYGRFDSWGLPEDFMLLCMLSNLGVTSREKALSREEISERTSIEEDSVNRLISKLLDEGLVEPVKVESEEKFYVTTDGVRRVLSLYS